MSLKNYVAEMSLDQRRAFAKRCGFSLGHLNNLMHGCKPCRADFAINIERETHGEVTAEQMAPTVDWPVVRHKATKKSGADKQRLRA